MSVYVPKLFLCVLLKLFLCLFIYIFPYFLVKLNIYIFFFFSSRASWNNKFEKSPTKWSAKAFFIIYPVFVYIWMERLNSHYFMIKTSTQLQNFRSLCVFSRESSQLHQCSVTFTKIFKKFWLVLKNINPWFMDWCILILCKYHSFLI